MILHQHFNSVGNYSYNCNFYTYREFDYHFHKNLEIIYVIDGHLECSVNNTTFNLKSHDFTLIHSYDVHSIKPKSSDTLYWVIVFSEDYVRTFANKIKGKKANVLKFNCSSSIENFINENLIKNEEPSLYILKSCLYALCEEYLNSVELTDKDFKEIEIMGKISDYVEKHHTTQVTLQDISKLVGYDYYYISKYFHSLFNMSFTSYLNIYRLETALNLLDETNKKISEVAQCSGFQSLRTFNACFKEHFGITPSVYRKRKL